MTDVAGTILSRVVEQAWALHTGLPEHPDRAALHHHARRALLDWAGVCLGAVREPDAAVLAACIPLGGGAVRLFGGGAGSVATAAWLHGTLSHLLDFDDTHVPSIVHTSGPVWAALWALGRAHAIPEDELLDAYIVAFQFSARLGDQGLGERLTASGWHVTPVLGKLAAAMASALALRLPAATAVHAIALAATSGGGLTASFGTLAKPLHAGAAARDAVDAVALARAGATGSAAILDGPRGLLQTLLQDADLLRVPDLAAATWEVTQNGFKPYASCQLTHASLDAACALATGAAPTGTVHAYVHPLAIQIAGKAQAATSAQAKFSLPFCIGLGLAGHEGGAADFAPARLADAGVLDWMARVQVHVDKTATRESARLVHVDDNGTREHLVPAARGSADNPLTDADLRRKFLALTRPLLGERADILADTLLSLGAAGTLADAEALLPALSSNETNIP